MVFFWGGVVPVPVVCCFLIQTKGGTKSKVLSPKQKLKPV